MDFENQKMLETMFSSRQTLPMLHHELLNNAVTAALIKGSGLDPKFALDLMAQMILHKRANVETLVGLLHHHFKLFANPFQSCADALQLAAERDLVDCDGQQFILRFEIDSKTQQLIRQYQYLPPMVVPPLEVTSNRGSGYVTIRDDSLVLKDNHHEGDLCLDSINRFNAIPLSINTDVVKQIRNRWKHLDHPKEDETFEAYQQRVKAFERYERDAFFTIALMVEMGNEFYLTHKVDKRGRTYAQGYHINPQGNCWNKACLELAQPEYVQ